MYFRNEDLFLRCFGSCLGAAAAAAVAQVLVDVWRDSQDFPRGCTLECCASASLRKKDRRWRGVGGSGGLATRRFLMFHLEKRTCREVYVWPASLQDLVLRVCVHFTTWELFYCLPGDILFLVTNVRLRSNGVFVGGCSRRNASTQQPRQGPAMQISARIIIISTIKMIVTN